MLLIAVALGLLLSPPSPADAGVGERSQTIVLQKGDAPADARPLPSEIPLFPLPEVSLFPGVSRPFLIFEPRYRDMIADALEGNRIIGMVALRQLSALRERLTQLLYVSLPLGVEPPDPDLDDVQFVNVTALNLRMSEAERQELLERNSVLARARSLVDRLDRK